MCALHPCGNFLYIELICKTLGMNREKLSGFGLAPSREIALQTVAKFKTAVYCARIRIFRIF